MGRSTLGKFLFLSVFVFVYLQSCVKDETSRLIPPPTANQSFVEEFDTVTAAYDRGWRYLNVSEPRGTGLWTQAMFNNPNVTGLPTPIPFPAYSSKGSYVGFIGADFTSTSAASGVISNWIVSPVVSMQNGDKIVFYTRTVLYPLTGGDSTDYVNRLQVRINSKNEGTDVGSGVDVGDFTNVLLDINPFLREAHTLPYDPEAYPIRWTRFEATVGGLNGVTKGRFGFRYFLEGAGSNGLGSGVAVDSVAYVGK
ncbi:MAG TPA: choice-of-anchor J domain-containing protein [Chitinophagaceae bacterium]|nr:choice-of-anchor J domain-containing protein [Chitinophagaceae bacterium]